VKAAPGPRDTRHYFGFFSRQPLNTGKTRGALIPVGTFLNCDHYQRIATKPATADSQDPFIEPSHLFLSPLPENIIF
jgi:hypothetical protein